MMEIDGFISGADDASEWIERDEGGPLEKGPSSVHFMLTSGGPPSRGGMPELLATIGRRVRLLIEEAEGLPPPATEEEEVRDLLRAQIGLLTEIRDKLDVLVNPGDHGR